MNEKAIELLCKKFGTTVEYLIPKAQAYGIWSNAVGVVICCLVIALEIWYVFHLRKKYGKEWEWEIEDYEFIFAVVGIFVLIIAVIVFCVAVSDLIMWATVPELGLLKLIK